MPESLYPKIRHFLLIGSFLLQIQFFLTGKIAPNPIQCFVNSNTQMEIFFELKKTFLKMNSVIIDCCLYNKLYKLFRFIGYMNI